MRQFHADLAHLAQVTDAFRYYYVTAYEMTQLIHQAECGHSEPCLDDLRSRARAAVTR